MSAGAGHRGRVRGRVLCCRTVAVTQQRRPTNLRRVRWEAFVDARRPFLQQQWGGGQSRESEEVDGVVSHP